MGAMDVPGLDCTCGGRKYSWPVPLLQFCLLYSTTVPMFAIISLPDVASNSSSGTMRSPSISCFWYLFTSVRTRSGRSPPASNTLNLFSSASTYSILTPIFSAIACATSLFCCVFHLEPVSIMSTRSVTSPLSEPVSDEPAPRIRLACSRAATCTGCQQHRRHDKQCHYTAKRFLVLMS